MTLDLSRCNKCQNQGHFELHCPFYAVRPEDWDLYHIRMHAIAIADAHDNDQQ
jgi:hypothetical protein